MPVTHSQRRYWWSGKDTGITAPALPPQVAAPWVGAAWIFPGVDEACSAQSAVPPTPSHIPPNPSPRALSDSGHTPRRTSAAWCLLSRGEGGHILSPPSVPVPENRA